MKNLKRNLSIILVIVMVAAMTACGSKSEEAKETESAESKTPDTEEVADETEEAEQEEPQAEKEEVTEEDVEAVKEAIKESVINQYLEPNGIAAESFTWPESSWEYLAQLSQQYVTETYLEVDMPIDPNFVPGSPEKEIMDAAYNGLVTWYEDSGEGSYEKYSSLVEALQPWQEVIPGISLAD